MHLSLVNSLFQNIESQVIGAYLYHVVSSTRIIFIFYSGNQGEKLRYLWEKGRLSQHYIIRYLIT